MPPLDFAVLALIAVGLYASAYLFLYRETQRLQRLVSGIRTEPERNARSRLIWWVVRGPSERKERLARAFTWFPPLMTIATAAGLIVTFLIAIAFLRVSTSIGLLAMSLLAAFPFYHSADAFDNALLSREARRLRGQLGSGDMEFLENAKTRLTRGLRYFRNLSLLAGSTMTLTLAGAILLSSFTLAPVAALAFAVTLATLSNHRPESGIDTGYFASREVAPSMAADHLAYGAVPLLNSTRARLMRKFALTEPEPRDAADER